ncbi:putative toxin-antitoxin system toxin component, PIN family [Dapis sp. BLCC M126]|uniref:putative toxin-antitoxin system toxin component, PIN family n=1 Tax=Dapis sp. BLCC M126 TaxID=3400189 RepID=UPI003CF39714
MGKYYSGFDFGGTTVGTFHGTSLQYFGYDEEATTKVDVAVEVNFPRDRKDEKFLASAVVSEANFLITGDYDFEEMQVLLPTTTMLPFFRNWRSLLEQIRFHKARLGILI